MQYLPIGALVLPMLLSACGDLASDDGGNKAEAPVAFFIAYHCDNGRAVQARYGSSASSPDDAQALLEIEGKHFTLYEADAASGTKYETRNGRKGAKRLIWWTKGDEAMWLTTRGPQPSQEAIVTTCRKASAPDRS